MRCSLASFCLLSPCVIGIFFKYFKCHNLDTRRWNESCKSYGNLTVLFVYWFNAAITFHRSSAYEISFPTNLLRVHIYRLLRGLTGSALAHRSLPPEFESRRWHIWRVFHRSLRFITIGGRSAHLAFHVDKSGRKTPIIILRAWTQFFPAGWRRICNSDKMWVIWQGKLRFCLLYSDMLPFQYYSFNQWDTELPKLCPCVIKQHH